MTTTIVVLQIIILGGIAFLLRAFDRLLRQLNEVVRTLKELPR